MHRQLGWALPRIKLLSSEVFQLPVHPNGPQSHATSSGTSVRFLTPLATVGSLAITLRKGIKQRRKQVKGRPGHTVQNKM